MLDTCLERRNLCIIILINARRFIGKPFREATREEDIEHI